jgi:hypothetical protein
MFRLIKLLLSPKTMFGISVGAAAAWFGDPERGPERRAQALEMLKQKAPGALPTPPAATSYDSARTPEPALWTPTDPPAAPSTS